MCLVVYRDDKIKTALFYRVTDHEWEDEIHEDLENLLSTGIEIASVTSDGGRNIIKAAKTAYPGATKQRCLAHIQRECLIWITKNPQSDADKKLRKIASKIYAIKTHNDRISWTYDFMDWSEMYKKRR